MNQVQQSCIRWFLLSTIVAVTSSECFALAISDGSAISPPPGNANGNSIVQVLDPAGSGTGTILKVQQVNANYVDVLVLTADHVIRKASSIDGAFLYPANQISIRFGNGSTSTTYTASDRATDFTTPVGGNSQADLAMLDVLVPVSKINSLPGGAITPVGLPNASPAANTAIAQAGYGLTAVVQGITVNQNVATVVPLNQATNLAYVNSNQNGNNYGGGYGTLTAGPNTVGAAGVAQIDGVTSVYTGANNQYIYQGFANGALINGNISNNYAGSTSYVLSGDSGGPSLSADGNTILGVHSDSAALSGGLDNDAQAKVIESGAAGSGVTWQDVDVASYLPWIQSELDTLSPVPEPSSIALMAIAGLGTMAMAIRRRRQTRRPVTVATSPT